MRIYKVDRAFHTSCPLPSSSLSSDGPQPFRVTGLDAPLITPPSTLPPPSSLPHSVPPPLFQPITTPLQPLLVASRADGEAIDYKAAYTALEACTRMRDEAVAKRKRGPSHDPGKLGAARGIRLLATLFGDIPTIVADAETYLVEGRIKDLGYDEFDEDLTDEQQDLLYQRRESEQNLAAYQKILHLVPELGKKLVNAKAEDMVHFYAAIHKAGNDALSECLSRVTKGLGSWMNTDKDRPNIAVFDHTTPKFDADGKEIRMYAPWLSESRVDCGPDHDICSGLLTSVDQDWNDKDVRTAIRESGKLSTGFFCRIFYDNFQGDLTALDDGFLMSRYMVKGYKSVFTGPSSVKDNDENEPPAKRQRNAGNAVAPVRKPPCEIFLMNGKVTPRSLAFICVLTSTIYKFSYPQLYNFIVDYLEGPRAGTPEKRKVDKLLAWWNKQIFPDHASSILLPRLRRIRWRRFALSAKAVPGAMPSLSTIAASSDEFDKRC
ncbi:hypothetical protein C8R45DRAFT_1151928 [Mycena sanguinolenta]|nr:hypothetical protein C8R45DRAFT_1151928 [Mycena sanguinolenta]